MIWKPLFSDHRDRSDSKSTSMHCVRSRFSRWLANTNIERAIDLALFMEEVQKNDCLYNKYSKEYRDKHRKINCWKAIGVQFD